MFRSIFNYRPYNENHVGYDPEVDDFWENNYPSNAMAWFADTFLRRWCKTKEHWSMRMVDYLWASCACCLFYRALTIGLFVGALLGVVITAAIALAV